MQIRIRDTVSFFRDSFAKNRDPPKATTCVASRMVGNAEVAPVDTVAPDAPSDTTEIGTPIQPQATTEDSTQQETPAETTTDTSVATEENTQAEQPATVQETPQENSQEETTQQQESAETEQQTNAE